MLKKLYIDINKVVCVQFKLKQPVSGKINSSKESLSVRALPVYAAPEFLQEPVQRCPVHVMTDKAKGIYVLQFIVKIIICGWFDLLFLAAPHYVKPKLFRVFFQRSS